VKTDKSKNEELYYERASAFRVLKDMHRGERCVLMGNGPSLNRMDLSILEDEIVIGLNKIYLLFDRISFRPTYIVSFIQDVVNQCKENYLELAIPTFVSYEARDIITPLDRRNMFYFGPHKRFLFSLDPAREICCGFTVTYVAMQLLFYMGFDKIILIGVDHRFNHRGPSDTWYVMEKKDNNHFVDNYFAIGQNWQSPNLKMAEVHYTLAKGVFEHFGREIVDATVNGGLNVFSKSVLKRALEQKSRVTK